MVKCTIWKQWKHIVSVLRKTLQTKILVSEGLNKKDQCSYQIVLFVSRKAQGSLKIKKEDDYRVK